jgi:hypothetical protein
MTRTDRAWVSPYVIITKSKGLGRQKVHRAADAFATNAGAGMLGGIVDNRTYQYYKALAFHL